MWRTAPVENAFSSEKQQNMTPPRGQKNAAGKLRRIARFRKAIQYRHKRQQPCRQSNRMVLSRKWATQNEMKTSALLIIFMDTFFSVAETATWRIRRIKGMSDSITTDTLKSLVYGGVLLIELQSNQFIDLWFCSCVLVCSLASCCRPRIGLDWHSGSPCV